MHRLFPIEGAVVTDAESDAELAAELAAIPDDYDWRTYYGDAESSMKELFATPVVGDGLIGDTLLGYDYDDDDEAKEFTETEHAPAGSEKGGQFVSSGGGSSDSSGDRKGESKAAVKSKAAVEPLRTGAKDRQADSDTASAVFGTTDTAPIAAAVGAPDDAVVKFRQAPGEKGKLQIEIHHDDLETPAIRFAYKDADGKLVIENSDFRVKKDRQGKGIGAKIFAAQVEQAAALGVDRIECHAACENVRGDREYNGYYTWPRFGYDQSLDSLKVYSDEATESIAECRSKFPGAKTVLDVMSTKEGAAWWKEKGVDMAQAQFDLKPGSRSMATLTAYLDAKKAAA